MSDNYITNVLNILRLIRETNIHGHAALAYLKKWSGTDESETVILRLEAYVQEQCDGACDIVRQSSLTAEAKTGLLQTVTALKKAFSLENIHNAVSAQLPQLDSSISSFAILASVFSQDVGSASVSELQELINEVDNVFNQFADSEIDPIVRDTARRHLHVLLTLLRNVDVLGLDAAMVAYAELVVRLRRVDTMASETARAKTSKIWPTITKWTERFTTIDEAINKGGSLLDHAHGIGQALLSYLP